MPDGEQDQVPQLHEALPPRRLELLAQQFQLRKDIQQFQRAVEFAATLNEAESSIRSLKERYEQLARVEQQLQSLAEKQDGVIIDHGASGDETRVRSGNRGITTSGLAVRVFLELAQLPTAVCHLFDAEDTPLITVSIKNTGRIERRVRVRSFVQEYSAEAVNTIELSPLDEPTSVPQVPTFFPDRLRKVTEITRCTLHVIVDDLDTGKIELHETRPIWLLARNSAPIRIRQPSTGQYRDMRVYMGAFVTPHEPSVLNFLSVAAQQHPKKRLDGYYSIMRQSGTVESQVRAIYDALKLAKEIKYVSSFIDFNPDDNSETQRVRLPRESLETGQANCLDGAVLFASLLEAISLQSALVYIPGHVMVAWSKTGHDDEPQWQYLDTTKLDLSFESALQWGQRFYDDHHEAGPDVFRFMPLDELRTKYRIMPLE